MALIGIVLILVVRFSRWAGNILVDSGTNAETVRTDDLHRIIVNEMIKDITSIMFVNACIWKA